MANIRVMKLSEAKVGRYIQWSRLAPPSARKELGEGPFKVIKVLKKTVKLEGPFPFTVTKAELSASFDICPLKYVA